MTNSGKVRNLVVETLQLRLGALPYTTILVPQAPRHPKVRLRPWPPHSSNLSAEPYTPPAAPCNVREQKASERDQRGKAVGDEAGREAGREAGVASRDEETKEDTLEEGDGQRTRARGARREGDGENKGTDRLPARPAAVARTPETPV